MTIVSHEMTSEEELLPNLLHLLFIIRNPGLSIKGFAKGLGVTERHASKVAQKLQEIGAVEKVQSGKMILLHPDRSSGLVNTLSDLSLVCNEADCSIEDIIYPVKNLRLVNVLRNGPGTIKGIISALGCSRPSFYRMLAPLGSAGCGLITVEGKKEKLYSLDLKHPVYEPITRLAVFLFKDSPKVELANQRSVRLTSLRSRLIIHLSSYLSTRDQFVQPYVLTQAGLALSLWTTQPIISKELKRLKENGMIAEKRSHVANKKLKYKTFHLTDKALDEMKTLRDEMERVDVEVVDLEGSHRQMKIIDIPSIFDTRIAPVEVLNFLSKEDVFNSIMFQNQVRIKRESEFISVLHRLPNLKYFFGRNNEKSAFDSWLENDELRIFTIQGIPGIGKTTFLSKIVQENKKQWNIFYYMINKWSTPRNILTNLALFLEKMNKYELRSNILMKEDFKLSEAMMILGNSLKNVRSLLIFDDVQKGDERVQGFLKELVESPITDISKLVFAGREAMPQLFEKGSIDNIKVETQLVGLDQKSSERLLAERGIKPREFGKIYQRTGGHPLALELLDSKTEMPGTDLKLFIKEEVMPRLTTEEKNVLRFISVFRHPFDPGVVMEIDPLAGDHQNDELWKEFIPDKSRSGMELKGCVKDLVDKSFLIYSDNSFRLHDIFTDFFYDRMSDEKRKMMHKSACRYYQLIDNDPAMVELLYHMVQANDLGGAVGLLEGHGERLVRRGFPEDMDEILNLLDENDLDDKGKMEFYYTMGEINYLSGEWDQAIQEYEKSIRLCMNLELEHLLTRAKIKTARLHFMQGDREKALNEYMEVIGLARVHGQSLLESYAAKQVGARYYFEGDIDKLKKYLVIAKDIAKKTKNRECQANMYFLDSFLSKLKKDYGQCEKQLRECMQIYYEMGKYDQYLMVMNNLGDLYYTQEKWDEALEIFEGLIDWSESVGDLVHKAFGLVNSGDTYIQIGDLDKAETHLLQALDLFIPLKEKRLIYGTRGIMANLYKNMNKPKQARQYFEMAIQGYEEIKIVLGITDFYYEYADMEEKLGDKKKAKELFQKCLKYAKQMDNQKWIEKAEERLGKL